MAHDAAMATAASQGQDMRDEREEDALFDRLARSLEALRRDAELVRSAMADPAIGESIARADVGLRGMAASLDAHTEALAAHRQTVEARIAQAAGLEDEIAQLRSLVTALSRRVEEAQMAAPAPLAPPPRRYAVILAACFAVLALVLVAGGAVLYWRGSLPPIRALGQSLAARVAMVRPARQESIKVASEPPPSESTAPSPQPAHGVGTVAPAAPVQAATSPPPVAPPAAAADEAPAPPPAAPTTNMAAAAAAPVAPPEAGPAPGPAPVPAPAAVAAPAPMPSPPPQVTLRAIENSWVEIRQRSGHVLLRRTLRQGESWVIPPDPDLLLSTGHAGRLVFEVKGALVPLNGGKPAALHDVPIDPDLIATGVVAHAAP
jgi:hypothetical protein